MSNVKEQFIETLIKEFNRINEDKVYHNQSPLDVCYLISSIDQHIEECKDFIDDISKHSYCFNGYDEDTSGGYTNGKIRILIEKPEDEKESEYIVDAYYNYCYYIEFLHDERDWGYCQCSAQDEGYNEENDCCGMGCDWTAPAFRLIKEIYMLQGKWSGQEKDYWEYEQRFNKEETNKNKEVEEYRQQQSIEHVKSQIKELEDKLKKLREE